MRSIVSSSMFLVERISIASVTILLVVASLSVFTVEPANSGQICQDNISDNKDQGALTSNQEWDAEIGCSNGDHVCSESGKLEQHAWDNHCSAKCAQTSGGSQICVEFCSIAILDCRG